MPFGAAPRTAHDGARGPPGLPAYVGDGGRVTGAGSALRDVPLAVDPDGLEARHHVGGQGRLRGDALEGGLVAGDGGPADLQALEGGSELLDLVEHRADRGATRGGGAGDVRDG